MTYIIKNSIFISMIPFMCSANVCYDQHVYFGDFKYYIEIYGHLYLIETAIHAEECTCHDKSIKVLSSDKQ